MSTAGSSPTGTAVITGASSGIGAVYADRLARRGYNLLLIARRGDRLDALAHDLGARYRIQVESIVADLSKADELEAIAQRIGDDPTVTLLVNNAGISNVQPLADTAPGKLQPMISINIVALSRLTMAVLPGFKSRNRGAIVNIGSIVGFHAYPGTAIYSGTKAYVLSFTQALQAELAGTAVVAQLVAPAATVSEIWDVAGLPLSSLDAAMVMTTENCVDAALRGLDMGEAATVPPVEDAQLIANFHAASAALLGAGMTGKPASRYGVGELVSA